MTAQAVHYDPCQPILHQRSRPPQPVSLVRDNQRHRRSQILATIRRLLTEEGIDGVTVRRIAQASGNAVQTVYSIAGPRNQAIIDAISEYTRFVGRTAMPRLDDPQAVFGIIDCWLESIRETPEFCRQVCLIFFTNSRGVYYMFRDDQLRRMCGLLTKQQQCGILRQDVCIKDLAEELVLLSSALCLEWSDRPFPLEELRRRLRVGYLNLLNAAVTPAYGGRTPALQS